MTVARSTRTAQPKVRFVKQYANWAGNVFRRYEAPDGRVAEVRVREGYQGRYEYTNAEARAEAAARLSGQPFAPWEWACGESRCRETHTTTSCLPVAPRCPRHGDPMRRRRGR